jgi:hypothetical protein
MGPARREVPIEWNNSMSDSKFDEMRGGQPEKSHAFQAKSRFAEVFRELFNLLEQYAPAWYTEEHHKRAVAALRVLQDSRQPANADAARSHRAR